MGCDTTCREGDVYGSFDLRQHDCAKSYWRNVVSGSIDERRCPRRRVAAFSWYVILVFNVGPALNLSWVILALPEEMEILLESSPRETD